MLLASTRLATLTVGDDQHERDAGEQHEQRAANRADGLIEHRHDRRAPSVVGVGIALLELPRDGRHVRLHLLDA